MEEARRVLERLARIAELERVEAPPPELLGELRELVREAEEWLRAETEHGGADDALARCRAALAEGDREQVMLLAH
jgi:triphosphoribosyl-dephospho-CoA synthetase